MAHRVAFLALAAATLCGCAATPGAPVFEEGYVDAGDGIRLYYRKAGSGPVVIAPGRLFLYEPVARLSDRYTVVSYDTRNRGRSSSVDDPAKMGIRGDIDDLEAVRRHFRIEKASLIGYSYMGLLVVAYAREHPGRVDRIVQMGPIPPQFGKTYPASLAAGGSLVELGAPAEAVAEVEKLMVTEFVDKEPRSYCEKQWAVVRYRMVGDPRHVERAGPGHCDMPNEYPSRLRVHFRNSIESIKAAGLAPEAIATVKHPVLTIHGRLDRNAPYGAGRDWAMALPNARLLTLPNAAHAAIDEYPDIVVPAIRSFLGGSWPAGAEKVTRLEG